MNTVRRDPTLLDVPRYRELIETRVPLRFMSELGAEAWRGAPPVEFPTPDEARKKGLPPTGWFDFRTARVAVVVDPDTPAPETRLAPRVRARERAKRFRRQAEWCSFVVGHEVLHYLWNWSPKQLGAKDQEDYTLLNIVADCTNEQRAGAESLYARRVIRRGRERVWQELVDAGAKAAARNLPALATRSGALPPLDSEPLWAAAYLSLRAHTFLAARGWRILRSARGSAREAARVWKLLEPELGAPPASIAAQWPEAWRLFWEAWRTANQFDHFRIVGEIRALFPPPAREPGPTVEGLDAHPGSEGERSDAPAAADSGTPMPGGAGEPCADDQGYSASPAGSADTGDEETPGAEPGPGGEGEEDEDLELDDDDEGGSEDDPSEAELDEEIDDLTAPAPIWEGTGTSGVSPHNPVRPNLASTLLADTRAEAARFADWLRAVRSPAVRVYSTKGRVVSRRVARDANHPEPFRSRTGLSVGRPPSIRLAMILDDSGSMQGPKIQAAARAAMTVAQAAHLERIPYVIVTSRHLELLAGDEVPLHRASAVLGGFQLDGSEGDNYSTTLPIFLERLASTHEERKVAIVVTDGLPNRPGDVGATVDAYRRSGAIVVGVGVGIPTASGAARGMREIFGQEDLCMTTAEDFARDLALLISSAIARAACR